MINMLPQEQRDQVIKSELIKLEKKIIEAAEFDLQWAGPIPFAERYVKLIGVDCHK